MSQRDALTLCIVMLGAVCSVVAGYPGADLTPLMRLPFGAVGAACTVGLAFMDKLGKPPAEPKPKRSVRHRRVDDLVERIGPADAEKALAMFIASKSDAIPQR